MRVHLVKPHLKHQQRFIDAVAESTALHHPWVYPPTSHLGYAAYVRRCRTKSFEGHLICDADESLVGVINLNEIVMGSFCSGYLGYYAFAAKAGQGLMKEGMRLVISRAFKELGLHRVEANIQPNNPPSLRLAEACGLKKEGFAPQFLKIGGTWRDHERWAITLENYPFLSAPRSS